MIGFRFKPRASAREPPRRFPAAAFHAEGRLSCSKSVIIKGRAAGRPAKTRPPWQITKPSPPGRADSAPTEAAYPEAHAKASFWTLALGSIGVVYGDIGTSPLYAFKESVAAAAEGGAITRDIVIGVLSLILWSLILVVTIKYVPILLRADNNGEGGTLTARGAGAARPRHQARHRAVARHRRGRRCSTATR